MRKIFEFLCESGERIERFVEYEDKEVRCNCGKTARRTISAPAFKLEGWSGAFPTAHAKFDKSHRDKLKSEQKANR
jgi:hypothetical protein